MSTVKVYKNRNARQATAITSITYTDDTDSTLNWGGRRFETIDDLNAHAANVVLAAGGYELPDDEIVTPDHL